MKLPINILASLCTIGFFVSGLALAEQPVVFIKDGLCGLLDDGGNPTAGDLRQVSVNNQNGNVTFTCSHDFGEKTNTGRSVIYNFDNTGELCGFYDDSADGVGTTDDWHQVISASGKAKLTCHYHE